MSQGPGCLKSTQYISTRLSDILKSGALTNRAKLYNDALIRSFSVRHSTCSRSRSGESDPIQSMLEIFNLEDFCAFLLSKILEDTLSELHILEHCITRLHTFKLEADMPKLLAEKFGIELPPSTEELEDVHRRDLGKDQYKVNKLSKDRHFLHEAIFQTFLDLCLNRRFERLAESIAFFYDRDTYYENLIKEEAENRMLRRDLSKQLRSQRIHNASIHYALDADIEKLNSEIEDSNVLTEVRSRYMTKWQDSREEQHYQTIEDTESTSLNRVIQYKLKVQDEHRVHSEVMRLMEIAIDDLLNKVEGAMSKYEHNIERVDLQIQIMKNNYQNQLEERMQLEETITEHEEDMIAWLKFKQDREDACIYRQKMNEAACVVQAWWRGLLVRQQLGPYKVKKGRKAKTQKML